MSLFYGYKEEDGESFVNEGGKMRAPINMSFWALKNIAAPVDDYDAVSKKYMETTIAGKLHLRLSVFHVFNSIDANVTKKPKSALSNNPLQRLVAYTPHSTSSLVVHSLTFDDDESLPTTNKLKIGIMTYRTDGTNKMNFIKKLDMQNVTAHTITMDDTVHMIVIQESFDFPDQHKDVFAFHPVLKADFQNDSESTLHVSVYDANPTFV